MKNKSNQPLDDYSSPLDHKIDRYFKQKVKKDGLSLYEKRYTLKGKKGYAEDVRRRMKMDYEDLGNGNITHWQDSSVDKFFINQEQEFAEFLKVEERIQEVQSVVGHKISNLLQGVVDIAQPTLQKISKISSNKDNFVFSEALGGIARDMRQKITTTVPALALAISSFSVVSNVDTENNAFVDAEVPETTSGIMNNNVIDQQDFSQLTVNTTKSIEPKVSSYKSSPVEPKSFEQMVKEGDMNYDNLLAKKERDLEKIDVISPAMKKIEKYLPQWQEISDKYGVPLEKLVTIAIIESGGDFTAHNSIGAGGGFQIMKYTAKRHGLDPKDRFDPIKSAELAAKILSTDYRNFDDYIRTIAVYNGSFAYKAKKKGVNTAKEFLDYLTAAPIEKSDILYVQRKVRKGDTLSKFARRYSVTVDQIMEDNGLTNHNIKVGQYLKVDNTAGIKQNLEYIAKATIVERQLMERGSLTKDT